MNNREKQKKIVKMFDDIASSYDLANRILSFGIDTKWRKKGCNRAYEIINKRKVSQIVDVATGTGDMLLHWRDGALRADIRVDSFVGIDPSSKMLKIAKDKVKFATFIKGEAQELPLSRGNTDIVSISYGIRNVVDRKKALEEFNRVLKNRGIVVILEFTKQNRERFGSKLVGFYLKKILPLIGGIVSRNYKAYRYLPDSIEEFLTTEMLIEELKESGFELKSVKEFSMGISTLIVAQKVKEIE